MIRRDTIQIHVSGLLDLPRFETMQNQLLAAVQRTIVIIFAVFLIPLSLSGLSSAFASQPQGATLNGWANVQWGMTENDVKVAYGGYITSVYPTKQYLDSIGTLAIRDYNIDESYYDIVFCFDKITKLLTMVQLEASVPTDAIFIRLNELLTIKYGQHTEIDSSSPDFLAFKWVLRYTTIDLQRWKDYRTRTMVTRVKVLYRQKRVKTHPLDNL